VRIQSKRLRYGVESLRSLLPKKRAKRWYRLAAKLQTDLGLARDQQLAVAIAERLHAARSILEHLRQAGAHVATDPA
jgi:CHAD domain-containing protein